MLFVNSAWTPPITALISNWLQTQSHSGISLFFTLLLKHDVIVREAHEKRESRNNLRHWFEFSANRSRFGTQYIFLPFSILGIYISSPPFCLCGLILSPTCSLSQHTVPSLLLPSRRKKWETKMFYGWQKEKEGDNSHWGKKESKVAEEKKRRRKRKGERGREVALLRSSKAPERLLESP